MIIVRTPFRVSICGGGTDFKEYYQVTDGETISFTIDKSIYVTVAEKFDGRLHLRYSRTEDVEGVDDLRHSIVKECLKFVGIDRGIEITIISDIPSIGTGLGSSGALTVGLLNALNEYLGVNRLAKDLARDACEIEIGRLCSPIGRQDQWAVALGGFRHYIFKSNGLIESEDLYNGDRKNLFDKLLNGMLLFYVPNGRKSSKILKVYRNDIKKNRELLNLHKSLVGFLMEKLDKGEIVLRVLGEMLTKAWEIKKKSSPASNEILDKVFEIMKVNGGLGGKVCGAGQGGFVLMITEERDKLISAMEKEGFRNLSFNFWNKGSEIIYRG